MSSLRIRSSRRRPGIRRGQDKGSETKRTQRGDAGFTLMEVLVAVTIFSLTVTLVYSLLAQAAVVKSSGRGLAEAVFTCDNFLTMRRLQGDAADYFFSLRARDLIRLGRADQLQELENNPDVYHITNQQTVYTLSCSAQVLTRDPLCFRGLLECRWQVRVRTNFREMRYNLSTVFVHEEEKGGARDGGGRD